MGKNLKRALTFLLCLSLVVASIGVIGVTKSSKTVKAASTFTDLDQEAIVADMGAGWNLGNQFEASKDGVPSETAWGNPVVTDSLIKMVKNAGFKTIRIPVSYLSKISYNSSEDKYEIDSAWLSRVQEVVDLCMNNGLYAIINMHGDGYTTVDGAWLLCNADDSEQVTIKKKYADCWNQIATTFKDYDEHLIFESMNEEFDGSYSNPNTTYYANINAYNQIFVDTVRQTGSNNAKRWLLIPGWNTNIDYTVGDYGFELPTDNYLDSSVSGNRIMISVHYYDPWDFAGAGYVTKWGKAVNGDSAWGQEAWMEEEIGKLYDKFVKEGYPVVIGEYGATDVSVWDSTNLGYRQYYYKYLCNLARENGCVPVVWDNNAFPSQSQQSAGDHFGLFNRWDMYVTDNGQAIIDSIMSVYNSADDCTSTGITLNKSSVSLRIGQTKTVKATLTPSTSTDLISWSSSDTKVAKVLDGVITPVAEGSCTITAKTANGNSADCEVTVEPAANVQLQFFLFNTGDWTTTAGDIRTVSVDGGTFVLSLTANKTQMENIGSIYVHDINADVSDTSTDKSSIYDSFTMKVKSFTINGTECTIDSDYDTYTYDVSMSESEKTEQERPYVDFDFVNVWNTGRKSIFTNTHQTGEYAYTFDDVDIDDSSNELTITLEISDVDPGDAPLDEEDEDEDEETEETTAAPVATEVAEEEVNVTEEPAATADVSVTEEPEEVSTGDENDESDDSSVSDENDESGDETKADESDETTETDKPDEATEAPEEEIEDENIGDTSLESGIKDDADAEATKEPEDKSSTESEDKETASPDSNSTTAPDSTASEAPESEETKAPGNEPEKPSESGMPGDLPTGAPNNAPGVAPTNAPTVVNAVTPAATTATTVATASATTASGVSDTSADNNSGKIKINLKNNKKYKVSKKVVIKATNGLKKVKLNGKKVKIKKKAKKVTFKLKKYKKALKKKGKKNKLVVVDMTGKKKTVKFKIK